MLEPAPNPETSPSRDDWNTKVIAMANDAFRQNPTPDENIGRWVVTAAIDAEGPAFVAACIEAVQAFDAFTEDNDPYGDHSFGDFEINGRKVWCKIDLFDADYHYGAPDPLDAVNTRRVLTILFPSDW